MIVHDVPKLIALTLIATSSSGCGLLFGCGRNDSTKTPLSVSDWDVSSDRYEAILMAAENGGDTGGDTGTGDTGGDSMAWDELDATAQCNLACAYALGELSLYQSMYFSYDSLTIKTCELTIPTVDADGSLACTATRYHDDTCTGGRRPLGWVAEPAPTTDAQQRLDGMAVMEQVSVTAFIELAAQLEARNAPAELVARCRAAAEDERRHVELLVGLGATPPLGSLEPAAANTSVVEIALHNAIEGCVTETWAALLARHQAEHAPDSKVRRVFEQIADDEANHAQLAWDLHAHFLRVLEPAAAKEIEAAQAVALDGLERGVLEQALCVPRQVRDALGLPGPRVAAALASDFGRRLSQRAAAC